MKHTVSKRSGFTLVELIIVILILAVLAAVIVPNVANFAASRGVTISEEARYTVFSVEGGVERKLGSIGLGNVLIMLPKRMFVNQSRQVSLSLIPLKEVTNISIDTDSNKANSQLISDVVQLYSVMAAELKAANFEIGAGTIDTKVVSNRVTTDWTWVISPRATGDQLLIVEISVPVQVQGFQGIATKAVYSRQLSLAVSKPFDWADFLKNVSIGVAILVGIITAFFIIWKHFSGRHRQQNSA